MDGSITPSALHDRLDRETMKVKEREMLRENAIMTEAVNFCRKRRLYAKAALAAGKIDGLQ